MTDGRKHPNSQKLLHKMNQLAGPSGALNYREFIQYALYDPEYGYYRRNIGRVGRNEDSDFYTSQSLGPVFGALVTDAIGKLLETYEAGPTNLSEWTFVEIGYESDSGWWAAENCPFGRHVQIGPGDSIDFEGSCIAFSNELFDAQPFHRIVYMGDEWRELGVSVSEDSAKELILPGLSDEVAAFLNQLPLHAENGYVIDLPLATRTLLKQITAPDWSGLFIALDYGKSWSELTHDFPEGTARAYYRHRQSPHLTDQPGLQDITCHICWDWLAKDLKSAAFEHITRQSQESFFIKHATGCIEKIITANPGKFDPQRQSLMHLLHPATMGQQFQVLSAFRQ
jgi:SAM-dependent MidA family methyltransferase